MVDRNASDLFIKAGSPPSMRIDGVITDTACEDVTSEETAALCRKELMTEKQWAAFGEDMEIDLAHSASGIGRFRVNVYRQRGSIGMVFRHVASSTMSFEELNLPPAVKDLSEAYRGMVLVTGTTGSGKSTTLAAMINHINETRRCHIVTIEDPIEFLHKDQKAIVSQREIGFDTRDFSQALKHVLRQSPDVILIGEMRDVETIQTAIAASETGHLVFSTLHTVDAVQTVERIINYFPAYLHPQIRMELGLCLEGVISMRLVPHASGKGRIPATEIMVATPIISKLLHEGKTLELPEYIERGGGDGMMTFDLCFLRLIQDGAVTREDALKYASNPDELRMRLDGILPGVERPS